MERSYKISEVGNYEELAFYYDELLQDEEALSLWLDELEAESFSTCLELAAGSAAVSGKLEQKGYQVLASDLSEKMKEAAKANYHGEYQIIDMSSFSLERKFDLIFCIVDSINYLNEDELTSCFASAYAHLNPGGRFIFDMHSMKRLEEFSEEYIEEGELHDVFYQWTILADPEEKTLSENFTFYRKDGMIQEHHQQWVYEPQLISEKMSRAGFVCEIKEDFIPDEKVLVRGRKI